MAHLTTKTLFSILVLLSLSLLPRSANAKPPSQKGILAHDEDEKYRAAVVYWMKENHTELAEFADGDWGFNMSKTYKKKKWMNRDTITVNLTCEEYELEWTGKIRQKDNWTKVQVFEYFYNLTLTPESEPEPGIVHSGSSLSTVRSTYTYSVLIVVSNLEPTPVQFIQNRYTSLITLTIVPADRDLRLLIIIYSVESKNETKTITDIIPLHGEPVKVTFPLELKFSRNILNFKSCEYPVKVSLSDVHGETTYSEFLILAPLGLSLLRSLLIIVVAAMALIRIIPGE